MVRNSSQHLLSLINDVLDISKIEAGQLNLSHDDMDVQQSMEKVMQSTRPLAEAKGLDLGLEILSPMESLAGDARRLEQILLNLLSNAIKFTEKGSVRIVYDSDADQVFFRVIDTGIGIRAGGHGNGFQILPADRFGAQPQVRGHGPGTFPYPKNLPN